MQPQFATIVAFLLLMVAALHRYPPTGLSPVTA
jgi:hypothetical protein